MSIIAIQSSFLLSITGKPLTFVVYFICDYTSFINHLLNKVIWFAFLTYFFRNTGSFYAISMITVRNASSNASMLWKTWAIVFDYINVCIFWNHVSTVEKWCWWRLGYNHLKLILNAFKLDWSLLIHCSFSASSLACSCVNRIIQITDCLLAC